MTHKQFHATANISHCTFSPLAHILSMHLDTRAQVTPVSDTLADTSRAATRYLPSCWPAALW